MITTTFTTTTNMSVQAGKSYKITNAKGGTVLDLSGGQDQSPITGYAYHGGDNQNVRAYNSWVSVLH